MEYGYVDEVGGWSEEGGGAKHRTLCSGSLIGSGRKTNLMYFFAGSSL